MALSAIGLNCTLKAGEEPSSTQKLLDQVLAGLATHQITGSSVRVANLNIKPGVKTDEGAGDDWPALRKQILDANILILATPIWMGQPSSISKRVLERMDAFLSDIGADGRYPTFGRVAIAAVVGNEDGAHHVCAEFYQALTDVGFTIPAGSPPYWVGEAMGSINYVDLEKTPSRLEQTLKTITRNAAHLAALLHKAPYPAK